MIKFFRKIRQNLLNEGKTTRYLKYAIGEILLVVIGILIALQINNWNTSQATRQTETEMLIDIRNALETDLENMISKNIEDSKIRLQVTKSILDFSIEGYPIPDSIPQNFIYLGLYRSYTPVISPYKLLESNGLDIISNKTLKYKIINLYTLAYEDLKILLENESNNLREVYRPEIRKHFKIYPPYFDVRYQPLSMEHSVKDHNFMNMITVMYSNNRDSLEKFSTIQEVIKSLINEIDKEVQ